MFVSVLDKQVQLLCDGDSVGAIVRIGHTDGVIAVYLCYSKKCERGLLSGVMQTKKIYVSQCPGWIVQKERERK